MKGPKRMKFKWNPFFTGVMFSIETLVGEIKPGVTEKQEFEN